MCYHVSTPGKKELKEQYPDFTISDYDQYFHTSAYTHPGLPAALTTSPDKIQPVQWGLIPFWAKDESQASDLMKKGVNARSETAFTTPMFRSSAAGHRCLIFVDGFFEWKHEKKGGKVEKIPHYIQMPDHKPFTLGGLWSSWTDKQTGELHLTCAILTTDANELMATIHNSKKRMPLILGEDAWSVWLDPEAPRKEVEKVMVKFPEGYLEARQITKRITARGVDTNVPEVQAAVA